jgi:hypothetical protein
VPALEQILCRGRFRHPVSYRRIPSLSTVCTRTFEGTPAELKVNHAVRREWLEVDSTRGSHNG